MKLNSLLSAVAIFAAGPLALSAAPGRNLFAEYLGATDAATDAKIDAAWKQLFYGDGATERVYCPVGSDMAYIYTANSDDVRSEGMSYGMMIAVQLDRKEEFDRLWKWAKTYMYHADGPRKGYFAWQCRKDGTAIDPGSASDGEEWFVTALFFASGRWGDGAGIYNYRAEANAILDTMLHKGDAGQDEEHPVNMFDGVEKQVRFVPLQSWAKITDPSYQLPAFYELWALWADKDNDFWSDAAVASREFFRKSANPATGLMPEYAHMDGRPFEGRGDFGFDAHRVLADVALDAAWFGKDPWEKEQTGRVLGFLTPYNPDIPYSFTLDGKALTKDHSQSIVAMASVAALAADRKTGEPFVRNLWNLSIPDGPYRYYNGLLYMIGLLQTGGRFHVYAPQGKPDPFAVDEKIRFGSFEYKGRDPSTGTPVGEDEYRNPILPGFRPDPSICRAGDDYYLVNSSFAYYPGVPIYKSRDLIHWKPLGHVLNRPSQLPLKGAGVSRGIYAPAIRYHNGTFYMVTTNVSGMGNFYVTAKNPAGPWSEPVVLEGVDGIDPSFFFDEKTGRAWLVNNGPAPDDKPLYDGHRAIWIQEFDAAKGKLAGPRKVIVNGGTDISKHPVWIEGPHLFRRGEWLYLICAEGGTSTNHSEVVFRAKDPLGPWTPYDKNPILTQRDLPKDRSNPVTSAGHADFVDAGAAGWWAVFLACRPYSGDKYFTGRETFLLPVTWTDDGWPVILEKGKAIPFVNKAPALPKAPSNDALPSGAIAYSDSFAAVSPEWTTLRSSGDSWLTTGNGLTIRPETAGLDSTATPTFLGYRVQNLYCEITLDVTPPQTFRTEAGLALFQSENFYYFMGLRRSGHGYEIFVESRAGGQSVCIASQMLPFVEIVRLHAKIDAGKCVFSYATGNKLDKLVQLAEADAATLTTEVAGGFVGATVGPYARSW